jgi:hypothetical protein
MVTQLVGELRREIRVYGVDMPVVLTLTSEGISFKVRGSKIGVSAPWTAVVNVCNTPDNAPGKLHGQPLAFLQDTARRIQASLIKRLDKEQKESGTGS